MSKSPRISPTVAPQIEALALPGCDAPIPVVRDASGQGWLIVTTACRDLGIDGRAQLKRLERQAWASVSIMDTQGADGRRCEMAGLRADKVALWLATLDAQRIKNESTRHRIQLWQKEAAAVLDAWVRGVPVAALGRKAQDIQTARDTAAYGASVDRLLASMESDRAELREMFRAQREDQRTLMGLVGQLIAERAPAALPAPAPDRTQKDWLSINELCTEIEHSSTWFYRRIRDKGGVPPSARRVQGKHYVYHAETVRKILAGLPLAPRTEVPPARWEPKQFPLPSESKSLRAVVRDHVEDYFVRAGIPVMDQLAAWKSLFKDYWIKSGRDPLVLCQGDVSLALEMLDVWRELGSFLMVCQRRMPESAEVRG